MPKLRFIDSTHARIRREERGISLEAMKAVVKYPQRKKLQKRGTHGGMIYRFSKAVEGKTLVVIAELEKESCWLITGFYA